MIRLLGRTLAGVLLIGGLVACGPQTSGTIRATLIELNGDLTTVSDFTVLSEGERIRFVPSPDGDYAFPLPHLHEHLRTGEPLLIGWELVDGVHVATFLDDG